MAYYLGIDGGGTKTYALLTDDCGNVLGKGMGGNGNHQIDRALAAQSIREAAEGALNEAGLQIHEVSHTYFGLAGADREVDYRILHPLVQGIGFTQNYSINCDTMISLRAGTNRPYGVALICGTGTNSAGRNPAGEHVQVGGFDYMYGDFGGGGSLNIEVFRSVIRSWDGREQPTLLTPLLLNFLGYNSVSDMFDDYQDHGKHVPVHAAKLLFKAAAEDDAVALEILTRQGVELGKSAAAVIHKLEMEKDTFDVVLAGSLLTRGDRGWIRSKIEQTVATIAPNATIVTLATEPVVGALWSAMDASGHAVSQDVYDKMRTFREFEHIKQTTR
ncbi:N-acetylglucosamine kinase [Paenibacillus sp. OK076]|uniref:N-acetylglucosamine kinase n=1 Tax=Paenibacillus sp. OK076 TaxID=1884379 RepID=UPI0008D82D7D|nr:BadF/BadG/BcrA/BcrD ATPase family protein [Paenibacillus sp. OK076]SEO99770.1 BadF-type ATPase [Paenibacillus sp. OK076]